jgi:hypothetical protein
VSYDEYRDMPCFAIGTLQESATTPTGAANLSRTSRQTKKLATNAPGDNGLVAKGKRTRKRSLRIAMTWMKTLRQNPPKKQRRELARATRSRALRREHSIPSLDLLRLRHREPPCAL